MISDDQIKISVKDNGPGIPIEKQKDLIQKILSSRHFTYKRSWR